MNKPFNLRSKSAFRNGMTIVITPKDEGLRDKSLNQCKWHKINAIKESQKFRTYGPP